MTPYLMTLYLMTLYLITPYLLTLCLMTLNLMTGVPSLAPNASIRGSVSDNTHERFTAVRVHAEPAEAASSGAVSHVVMVGAAPDFADAVAVGRCSHALP